MNILTNMNNKKYEGVLLEFLDVQNGDKIQLNQIKFTNDENEIKIINAQINCKKCESFGENNEIFTNLLTNNNNKKWCTCLSYFPHNIAKLIFLFESSMDINNMNMIFKSANDNSCRDPKTFKIYGLKFANYNSIKMQFTDDIGYINLHSKITSKELIHSWNNVPQHSKRHKEKIYKLYKFNDRIIPKNIFQTHKSLEYTNSKKNVKEAIQSWKQVNDFNYYFFTNEQCKQFMVEHFDERTNEAYDKCPFPVMKADMWRYCVIFIYGGIYADSDTILETNPLFMTDITTYLAITTENKIHFCQWVFSAPPQSPILKEIIDLSVKRVLECNDFTKKHIIHETTGPAVFSGGILLYLIKNNKQLINKNNNNEFKYKLNDDQTDFIEMGTKDCEKYVHYNDEDLVIFNPTEFHYKKVTHFFTGQSSDGWCNQRKKMIEEGKL